MIIWLNDDNSIRMVSYTPRDRGTMGGYDVKSIPEPEEGGEIRFDPKSKQFYTHRSEELAKARETGLCPTCGQEVDRDIKEEEPILRR